METTPQAFSQLLDRSLPCAVTRASWCPTMDLLALLTTDGQLQLHRLNWQRLWSVAPESPITALVWRPDGKQLAAGLADGTVLLLSAENGEILKQARVFSCEIVSLAWAHSSEGSASGASVSSEDRSWRFFEPTPTPRQAANSAAAAAAAGHGEAAGGADAAAWPPRLGVLSVLCCASAAGEIALLSDGLYLLAKTSLLGAELPPDGDRTAAPRIRLMAMPPSLGEVAVCWESTSSGEKSGKNISNGGLNLTVVDASAVGDHVPVLRALCAYAEDILAGVKTCRAVCWEVWKECSSVKAAMGTFTKALDDLLQQHGLDSDAQSDLLLLITMGEYTSAMEQFLMSAMGEAGLKRTARAVDAALCAAHALLVDRLHPELELLAFRLGELRGLAAAPANRAVLQLRYAAISATEDAIGELLWSTEALRERLMVVAAQHRTFFSWLTTAMRRFPEDTVDTMMGYPLSHVDTVRRFLHAEFINSTIEPILSAPDLDPAAFAPSEESAPPPDLAAITADIDVYSEIAAVEQGYLDKLLMKVETLMRVQVDAGDAGLTVEDLAQDFAEGQRTEGTGLLQALAEVQISLEKDLLRPAAALSRRIAAAQEEQWTWQLTEGKISGEGEEREPVPAAIEYTAVDGALKVAYGCHVGDAACIASMTPKFAAADTIEAGAECLATMVLPEGYALMDVGCYKDGALALLLQREEDSEGSVILLPSEALNTGPKLSSRSPNGCITALPQTAVALEECRRRSLPHRGCLAPMAVSASRGTGFVLNGAQRALLLDLEEDEEAGEGEEEGEGGMTDGENT